MGGAATRDRAVAIGLVLRRTPDVMRCAPYAWKAVAALPGAEPADGRVLRDGDGVVERHVATPSR